MSKLESIHTTAILEDGTKVSLAMIITSLMDRVDALETALDAAQRHDASSDRDLADELEQVKVEQMELRQELESVQSMAMCEAEVNDMIEEAVEEHERQYSDNLDDDHIHDLIATYIMDDNAGTLRRKVIEIVADKLLGR